jgi:hypothetical protein
MMKIQIHSSISNMSTTGRQVLGDLQDSYTPLVDLLVRESIQNSTDAARPISNADDDVCVSYDIVQLNNAAVNPLFESISDKLDATFPRHEQSDCLIIRDTGTTGLTGHLKKEEVQDGEDWGNLIKLIYEIRKPQENSGAGGAWGLGKTVYYRLGQGIVIYYSRIENDGHYESRLAACIVEDEKDVNSLLPACPDDGRKSGIAWWGADDGYNRTIPITNSNEIKDILNRLQIDPYTDTETGTTIIIPYLKTNKLLDITRYINENNSANKVYAERPWMSDLSQYLEVAAQRWYYPRIDNASYSLINNLRKLKIKVDGEELNYSKMAPIFQLMQSLYNRSINQQGANSDFIEQHSMYYDCSGMTGTDDVKVNVYLQGKAGSVSYARANDSILGMIPPSNDASPYKYFDLDDEAEEGSLIVAYSRKPGMVIWYDIVKATKANKLPIDNSNFIFGHFALQSSSIVVNGGNEIGNLEDFVRATETANHKCWNNDDYSITQNIKRNVTRKIIKAFEPKTQNNIDQIDTGLGVMLGGLLPPRGFGNKPSSKRKSNSTASRLTGKKSTLKVSQVGNPEYSSNKVTLNYRAEVPANFSSIFSLELSVATDGDSSKSISVSELKSQMHVECPFEIV